MNEDTRISEKLSKIINSEFCGVELSSLVRKRIEEFKKLGEDGFTHFDFNPFLQMEFDADLFSELCFCILTAGSSVEIGLKIQRELGDRFSVISLKNLFHKLQEMGHRFAKAKSKYIVAAREFNLDAVRIQKDGKIARQILLSLDGLGLKESSHFLRNIGFDDVAIIDRHIFRFLVENKLYPLKNTITPKVYLECEKILEKLSQILWVSLSELDLYIFFDKTSKILK